MRTLLLSALLGASFALTNTATAESQNFSPWVGSYQSASPERAKDVIERAIEDGTSALGPLRRSVARKRLKSTNGVNNTVRIIPSGDELITDFDGRTYRAPTTGEAEQAKDPDGKLVAVSYRAVGDTLKSRYVAEDGEKRIDFKRTPDGHGMIMHVTVISEKLPAPIKYSLSYKKKE